MLTDDKLIFYLHSADRTMSFSASLIFCMALLSTTWINFSAGAWTDAAEIDMDKGGIGSSLFEMIVHEPPGVLFSMTTTLHILEKENFVSMALESFVKHHPDHSAFIKRWLVINEYSEDLSVRAEQALQNIQRQFPFIETYQKQEHEQGQANSLNIILGKLRTGNCTYWLHMEESWRTVRPFLGTTVRAMDAHPYLHQLQLYRADYYLNHTHTRITDDVKVVALNSHVDLIGADPRAWRTFSFSWPSYSLRPSLTRVGFLKDHADLVFDTNPDSFPVIFELDFAVRWQLQGGSMCALMQEAIVRQEGHRSTYALES